MNNVSNEYKLYLNRERLFDLLYEKLDPHCVIDDAELNSSDAFLDDNVYFKRSAILELFSKIAPNVPELSTSKPITEGVREWL